MEFCSYKKYDYSIVKAVHLWYKSIFISFRNFGQSSRKLSDMASTLYVCRLFLICVKGALFFSYTVLMEGSFNCFNVTTKLSKLNKHIICLVFLVL